MKKLTSNDIDRKLEGRTVKIIDNYINCSTKISFECLICNYIWKTIPSDVFKGCDCPKCSDKILLTNNDVDDRLKGRNIKRIGEYINTKTKIPFECLICNNIWSTVPGTIFVGTGCPKCSGKLLLTNDDVDKRLKDRNIKRIGEYINTKTKIQFMCLVDGHKWVVAPMDVFSGNGCPKCADKKLTNDILDKRIENKNIKRIGTYITSHTKIEFKCLTCANTWFTSPEIIFKNSGCTECSMGKNEKRIKKLVQKHCTYNIFESHKPLRFNNRKYIPDFYLESGDNRIIVEYNGMQHYKPIRFGGISQEKAEEKFLHQNKRDVELRQYCKENDIILLEIPYWWKDDKIIEELKILNGNK